MCEPVSIAAVTTGVTTAVVTTAPVVVPTAVAVGTTAAVAAPVVGGGIALTGVGTLGVGIGGAGLSSGVGLAGVGGGIFGVGLGGAGLSGGAIAGGGISLTLAEGIALTSLALGVAGATFSGVDSENKRESAKKGIKRNAASQKIAALNANQQGSEAAAQTQFEASRAALAAAGKIKATNLGDRSVAALSRAVGFELGSDKATIKRNQEIANLEASARLFGIQSEEDTRRNLIGETGGLTFGLNTGATFLNSGASALQIRNRLSN